MLSSYYDVIIITRRNRSLAWAVSFYLMTIVTTIPMIVNASINLSYLVMYQSSFLQSERISNVKKDYGH